MFSEFRQNVKALAKKEKLNYASIASKTGLKESTIKSFMCGANDSRRVAEKIADIFGIKLLYCNGTYTISKK